MDTAATLIVAVEGIDGAGKSTFTADLRAHLARHYEVATAHTPGPRLSAITRDVRKTNPDASYLAFLIGNADVVQAHRGAEILIIDRYILSTIVHHAPSFQRWAGDLIGVMESMSAGFPHITVMLDVEVTEAQKRLEQRSDTTSLLVDLTTQRQRYLESLHTIPPTITGTVMTFSNATVDDAARAVQNVATRVHTLLLPRFTSTREASHKQ